MKAPEHLQPATRAWWESIVSEWDLEVGTERILTAAAEAWDRYQQARSALDEHGLTFTDRLGNPRARPEVGVERDARLAFVRCLRELGLRADESPAGAR